MKKYLCAISILLLLLTVFTSCNEKKPNPTENDVTGVHDERDIPTQKKEAKKIEKGANTGTKDTYTGFKPLPSVTFNVNDPSNKAGLSTAKIEHSFGKASNEVANDISFNSQKYFDSHNYNAITLDTKTDKKVLYLTFDCGYENGQTDKILDILKEKNVRAAFFCTLHEVKQNPELTARMITEGHIVGNHTVTHPSMDEISRTEMAKELQGFEDYLRTNFGYSAKYFRFPKGEYSDSALDLVSSIGYTSVFWSVAYEDWDLKKQKGADYALSSVTKQLHPGAIILLHSVSPDNTLAMPEIIDKAREMGYEFKSLESLPCK